MLKVKTSSESFPIAGTFTISRGSKTSADVVVVQLERNGVRGWGEGVPYPRYAESVPQCLEALTEALQIIEQGVRRTDLIRLKLPKAAQNALDCALWDLEAREARRPAWQLADLQSPEPCITAFTISLDAPEAMFEATRKAADYPLLKVKLGKAGDEERIAAVRAAAPHKRLLVDANEGWTSNNVEFMLACCAKAGVELVEQPLPQGQDEILAHIKHPAIICADESAHDTLSLPELKGRYDAVNIKLDKTGGLTEALHMAHAAREQGFNIMVGCMLASSLGMAPAFLVAQLADYVDLDGPLWLKKDRIPGISYDSGLMQPPPPALWG